MPRKAAQPTNDPAELDPVVTIPVTANPIVTIPVEMDALSLTREKYNKFAQVQNIHQSQNPTKYTFVLAR